MQRLYVLPVLLQQGDQEVDGQHGVGKQFIIGHLDVTNGDSQTQDLLQLELESRLDFVDLLLQVFGVRDGSGELSSLGETGSEETRNLLDQSFGGDEGIVLLGQLLYQPVERQKEKEEAVLAAVRCY